MTGNNLLNEKINTVIEASKKAGNYLINKFKTHNIKYSYKGEINIVTECDLESQKIIIDHLKNRYPDISILAEEMKYQKVNETEQWIIDPLDGTTNFIKGISHFCISIAYQYKGKVCFGVIYNPITNELFYGIEKKGSFLNGEKILVSRTNNLIDSIISSGFPYGINTSANDNLKEWACITKKICSPRCTGSAALDLCYVACGRFDAHWELDLGPWDMAAGEIIIREAGGIVTDITGMPFNIFGRRILASNGLLHNVVRNQLIIQ